MFLYIAPEVSKSYQYTKACDAYAFAYIAYGIIANIAHSQIISQLKILIKISTKKKGQISSFQLIDSCWSDDHNERPTLEQIVHKLKTDSGFIPDLVEKEDFLDYVEFIDSYRSPFDSGKHIKVFNFLELHKSCSFQKAEIQKTEANAITKSQQIPKSRSHI